MCRFALRPVFPLLPFGVGIAASSLFNFNSSRKPHRCAAPAPAAVLVASPSLDEPPPHACCSGTLSGGNLNGKVISQPALVYPTIAKAPHAGGTVSYW